MHLSPDEMRARVLYRDALMIVVDKPPGLPVHAGAGGGATVERALDALRFELSERPGLAHRLDRDTSGCLVLGRTRPALKTLGRLFARGQVEKLYWAIIEGTPPTPEGRIDQPLKRRAPDRNSWRMAPAEPGDPDGQTAVTDYKVLGAGDGLAWLGLWPRTGRTHQIRVHCAALGCPIVGDWVYGAHPSPSRPAGAALCLHARAVSVPLYWKQPPIAVAAEPPPHMRAPLAALGWQPGAGDGTPQGALANR